MGVNHAVGEVNERVQSLVARYSTDDCSVAHWLCDVHPADAIAYHIIHSDGTAEDLTYGALRLESERFADVLAGLGVGPGDRVATLMGKSREYLVALVGLWRLGAVHVPLFTAFAPPAIEFRLTGSKAKVVITDAEQQAKLVFPADESADGTRPWHVISTGDPQEGFLGFQALIADAKTGRAAAHQGGDAPLIHIYTSGTTGTPKGVIVPVRALASSQIYAELALGLESDDLYWCAADPGWAYGLYCGVLACFTTGVRGLLVAGGFVPERTLALLASEGVTNFTGAPTIYRALRNTGLAVPEGVKVRHLSSAGEPLTPEVNDWARAAFGIAVLDHYGQTETGMTINNHHHAALAGRFIAGSMGQPMPGWAAAVLCDESDELAPTGTSGRVALDLANSPLAWFGGYDGDDVKTAERFTGEGRWFLTGDTAYMDEDGNFHFSSRADDVILMAGYRIGPFEVESVLVIHPAVAEAAVIAVPDEIRGELLEAYVVLRNGEKASDALAQELQQWVKTRYAAHAFPRTIHFASSLPKTESGKLQRYVLKQRRRAEIAQAQTERRAPVEGN